MIGPDHYRAAEDLLGRVAASPDNDADVSNAIALAQVHATLALAAATALAADPTPDALELWDDMLMYLDAVIVEDDGDDDDGVELGANGHPGLAGG